MSAFIFRKKRENDTYVAVIPDAHYSVVLRTVAYSLKGFIFHLGVTTNSQSRH